MAKLHVELKKQVSQPGERYVYHGRASLFLAYVQISPNFLVIFVKLHLKPLITHDQNMCLIFTALFQNRYFKNLVGRKLAWALAHRASEQRKLLVQQENLLVRDGSFIQPWCGRKIFTSAFFIPCQDCVDQINYYYIIPLL